MGNGREKCSVEGKDIYPTRGEARADRPRLASLYGQAKVYRCSFGEHYHITKGARARKWRR
jgi:hypothetical protein